MPMARADYLELGQRWWEDNELIACLNLSTSFESPKWLSDSFSLHCAVQSFRLSQLTKLSASLKFLYNISVVSYLKLLSFLDYVVNGINHLKYCNHIESLFSFSDHADTGSKLQRHGQPVVTSGHLYIWGLFLYGACNGRYPCLRRFSRHLRWT